MVCSGSPTQLGPPPGPGGWSRETPCCVTQARCLPSQGLFSARGKAAGRLRRVPAGKSEFGEVFLAKAQGLEEGVPETLVLVKSLQSRDEQQQLDFRREFEMFGKLNHANVVRLLGLCREAEPHYMVLEYVDLVCCWPGPCLSRAGQCSDLGGGGHRGNLLSPP